MTAISSGFAGVLPVRGGVELARRDEHPPRLGALVAGDDPAALEHVDQAACARVADAKTAREKRYGGGLRLDDDVDRLLEQRVLVRVEVAFIAFLAVEL